MVSGKWGDTVAVVRLFGAEENAKPKRGCLFRITVVLLPLMLMIAVLLVRLVPRIEMIVLSAARNAASDEIDEAVLNYMETNGITYGKLVDINCDKNGAITSVTADTAKIDILIARLDDEIGSELEEVLMDTYVPLNVILGTELFIGGGPKVKIHFFPISVVNVQPRHEFVSQGINQTLHTVFLDVSVDIEILFPFRNRVTRVDAKIPIGQTLIVGGVPATYVER